MVSAAGCVLCLSQGGALGEGASQAAFVPFVPGFNIPSASPQHHPGTAALLAQWSPSKYHHFDFNKIKPGANVPPLDFPDGFGSLLCLEEVWLILSCCLSAPSLPALKSLLSWWTSRDSKAVVGDKYGFGGGSWLISKCRNPGTSNTSLLLCSTHSCTSFKLGLQKKSDWGGCCLPHLFVALCGFECGCSWTVGVCLYQGNVPEYF